MPKTTGYYFTCDNEGDTIERWDGGLHTVRPQNDFAFVCWISYEGVVKKFSSLLEMHEYFAMPL